MEVAISMATPAPQIRENLFIVYLLMKACRTKWAARQIRSMVRTRDRACTTCPTIVQNPINLPAETGKV
jgi:hypothetical protein